MIEVYSQKSIEAIRDECITSRIRDLEPYDVKQMHVMRCLMPSEADSSR